MIGEQKAELLFQIPLPVKDVLDRLCEAGYEAFLVGGCVRDVLRGVQPHDYDLTTNALPADMHRVLHGLHMIDTGIQHGTITVLHSGIAMEVTTYRVDGDYRDNRHPDAVQFTTSLREDVARRDFTMNALAYHPAVGLRDYFGGRADIADRCIRAVGDPMRRFEEDALRILRALRFSSVLGFTIEPATAAAARVRAPLLCGISAERVHEELDRLLCGAHVEAVLCAYSDVLAVVLPDWAAATDDKTIARLAACIAALPGDKVVRYAALLAPLPPTEAEQVLQDLRFDRRTRERVCKLLLHKDDPCTGDQAVLRHLLAGLGAADARLLLDWQTALAATAPERDEERLAALADARFILDELVAAGSCCTVRDLAICGEDLRAIGYTPGREMGLALQAALAAVLDGRIPNEKEPLLAFCRQRRI